MLKLIHCPGTSSTAPLIALYEAEAEFEIEIVDLAADEQKRPEFLAVNPKGKVPVLVTDRGVLTENPAILSFIAQTYPQARLAPLDDPFAFARMQSFISFVASTVQQAWAPVRMPDRYSDDLQAYDSLKRKGTTMLAHHFSLIEHNLFEGPYVMGSEYTVADACLFVFSVLIGRVNLDPDQYPRILEHRERVGMRPAVVRAVG